MNKRHLVLYKGLILTMLLLTLTAGCSRAKTDWALEETLPSGSELTLFTASDLHYLAPELHDNGPVWQKLLHSGDGRQLPYIDEIADSFAHDIGRLEPDVVILSGDLTQNGEKASHEALARKLRKAEEASGARFYVIPGNHDINNPWARSFIGDKPAETDYISPEDFARIYEDFGYGEAVSRDKSSLSYLAAPSEDLWILMLDTNRYNRNVEFGGPVTGGRLGRDTLNWIREMGQAARENGARLIASMHHNLYNHSYILHNGYTISQNYQVEKVLREAGVDLVFTGHIHVQDIKSTRNSDRPIYDVASGALAVSPHQYGVTGFSREDGFRYRTQAVDVEGWAREMRAAEPREERYRDKNLIGFAAYTETYFAKAAYDKAMSALEKTDEFTAAEKEEMARTMGLLNTYYFAGRMEEIREEVKASPGYKLWRKSSSLDSLGEYIRSMAYDYGYKNTELTVP